MNFAMKWRKGIPISNNSFNGATVLLPHLLDGNKVTKLEELIIFAIQNPASEPARFRKADFKLKLRDALRSGENTGNELSRR